jgi:predicted SprT family Zn-dependent metalloprotease
MRLVDAKEMAISLMHFYGVKGYSFIWMVRREKFSRAGQCSYKDKTISLAPKFVELNHPCVVKWTILHEIAHALRPKHNHNKFWKETARQIGHSGNRCYGKYVKIK